MAGQRQTDERSHGQETPGTTIKRRGILAAAGAVVAGIVAKQASQPVAAASGTGADGNLVLGSDGIFPVFANTATRNTVVQAANIGAIAFSGKGVFEANTGVLPTSVTTDGLRGSGQGGGAGVIGFGSAKGTGVGAGPTPGPGVIGVAYGTTAPGSGTEPCGVYATSVGTPAAAIRADADQGDGVVGSSTDGNGVYGTSYSIGVGGHTYGTKGSAISPSAGIYGTNDDTHTYAYSVWGKAGGSGVGVQGDSPSGFGVNGTTVSGTGVLGSSTGIGSGVHGDSTGAGPGVYATNSSSNALGDAVLAANSGAGRGIVGSATANHGIYGSTGAATGGFAGVYGTTSGSGSGIGVKGTSTSGTGVAGTSTSGSGVVGGSGSATPGTAGGYFYTTVDSGSGVVGQCFNPGGGAAAFVGAAVAPNYAAYFTGNVVVSGKLVVSDPSYKSGALRHPDGSTRLVYCVESPESWIEDVGTGTLTGGKATVIFDKDFTAVTHTDDYHVFLTPYGSIGALRVALRKGDSFAVEEIGGTSSGTFSWKVMVKAKSEAKAERLGKFTMPTITVADKPPVFPAPIAAAAPLPVSAPAPQPVPPAPPPRP